MGMDGHGGLHLSFIVAHTLICLYIYMNVCICVCVCVCVCVYTYCGTCVCASGILGDSLLHDHVSEGVAQCVVLFMQNECHAPLIRPVRLDLQDTHKQSLSMHACMHACVCVCVCVCVFV